MTWFNNLNLQWKILGTIGAVCALMIAVGGLGMKTAGDVKKDLDTVGSDLLPSERALSDTQAQLLMAQRDMRSALLTDDQKVSEQFIASTKQHVDEAAKSWEPYQHRDHIAEQKPQIAEFEKGFAGWRSAIDQAITETAKKTPAGRTAATDILMTKVAPQTTAMNTAIASLQASEAQEATVTLDEAHATFSNALKLMIARMALSTAAALALGFNLARTIQRGVAEVRRVVTSMADNCATNLAGALGAMAGGDLTVTVIPVTTPILHYAQDEIGQTAIATNKLLDKVQASINGYAEAKTGLTDLVSQVQASANTLAATAEQVGSAAGQTGSAVNQVASSISQVASGAGQQAGDLDAAVNAVHELNTHAQAVGQMVALIEDIAERTDLLALNAAIESARAGEHGRGFAVVADEVRKLAEKATETVREIGTAIREMSTSSTRVNDATTSVAAVSGETAAAAEEIAATAEEMSAQVEETAAQAEELSTPAQELQMLVNRFKLEGHAEAGSHDRRPVPLRRAA